MVKDSTPTQEQFDSLLTWLDTDREQAANKYEVIRRRLIEITIHRGCNNAEDLADETINRVASKVQELKDHYTGDPASYFYGVVRKLILEQRRLEQRQVEISTVSYVYDYDNYDEKMELMFKALDQCLANLAEDDRDLILNYYQHEKQAKISQRKVLAQELQLTSSTLRKRVHRIRIKLEKCAKLRLKMLTEMMSNNEPK